MSTENGRQSPGYFLEKNLNEFAGKSVKYIKVSPSNLNTQISQRSDLNSSQKKRPSNEGLISIEI